MTKFNPGSAPPAWRVAEFRSSANPGLHVLMLAESAEELREWPKRGDFIKWHSPDAESRMSDGEVAYPRDLFLTLISQNSPYAFYLFQWVPYQTDAKRWRLKMLHDVRTFDGREAHGVWPNGSHFGQFSDDEIEFIRISKTQHGDPWMDPRPDGTGAKKGSVE